MSQVLRFPNGGKRRVVRRVVRRSGANARRSPRVVSSSRPTRVMQQPITRRVRERPELDEPGKIAIYGSFELDIDLHNCLDPMDSVMIAGTVETLASMVAMTAMSKAELAIIELNHGGPLAGLEVARATSSNSPAQAS